MTAPLDLVGQKFHRWTVLEDVGRTKAGKVRFLCICECGEKAEVVGGNLRSGLSKSCGCLNRESASARRTTHGLSDNPAYHRYMNMMSRCYNPASSEFENYGGRGITVCERWRESIADFLSDVGLPPSERHSLDRIDNDGDYEPSNVRWADKKTQSLNRRVTRFIEWNGETLSLSDWARKLGLSSCAVRLRLVNGWSIESALSTPPIPKGKYERQPGSRKSVHR